MASERRTFLNKINKRVKSLTDRGVDLQDILEILKDKLPSGAYITEFNQVNIDPTYWDNESKTEIMAQLEEAVPMYWTVREEALKPYENFIGPLSKQQINNEVRSYYWFQRHFFDLIAEYYDMEQELLESGQAYAIDNGPMGDLLQHLRETGSHYNAGDIPYSRMQDAVLMMENIDIRG